MEWFEKLNKAIDYIEKNLDKKIDYDELAAIACCSTYHFQRMFSYIANVPLSEYIRRRRMTLAAFDIQTTNKKIIDISLKYGYESPTAFNRAFQNVHGISPNAARALGVNLKSFPPMRFKLIIKGDREMNYRIEKKEAFRVIGVKRHFEINPEEGFMQVPYLWQEMWKNRTIPKIASLIDGEPHAILGIATGMSNFDYYIAGTSSKEIPEGMVEYIVPEGTYAVFECTGLNTMQEVERKIISEWLPTSGYEYADTPDIEVFFGENIQAPSYKSEVWFPIIKKEE